MSWIWMVVGISRIDSVRANRHQNRASMPRARWNAIQVQDKVTRLARTIVIWANTEPVCPVPNKRNAAISAAMRPEKSRATRRVWGRLMNSRGLDLELVSGLAVISIRLLFSRLDPWRPGIAPL